jgi:hypothetical protein
MLVQLSDFEGELTIAQIEHTDVAARVEWFINKYEDMCLRKLLGEPLAEEFYIEYARVERAEKWDVMAKRLKPICAKFVYYYYQRNNETLTTAMGEVEAQVANATRVSIMHKAVAVWNEMLVDMTRFYRWLDDKDFPKFREGVPESLKPKNTFGI